MYNTCLHCCNSFYFETHQDDSALGPGGAFQHARFRLI